jgi:hypothetical protein
MWSVRLLVVLLALSLLSTSATAGTQVGVTAGFNMATLRIDGADGIDARTSFAAGGVVDLGINDRFGIRIEPTFTSKGGKATQRNAYWGTMDGAVFKIDCIDVPVLARFDLGASEARGYLLGGVGVSFATETEVELTQGNDQATVDFADVFSSTDLSLDLGAGISFPAGTHRMTIDGRVGIGLIDINEGGTVTFNGSPLTVPSTTTNTLDFRLMATYLFPWGK